MRVVTLLTVAGLASGMVPCALGAQAAENVHLASAESATPARVRAEMAYDDRNVRRRMESAERAMERGSPLTAQKIYESVVKDLSEANVLPTEAMWKLATLRFVAGNELEAASILDGLATAAATYGDVVVEVRALIEAAHIYQLEGKVMDSVSRLDRAFGLLSTSDLPSDMKVALLKTVRG